MLSHSYLIKVTPYFCLIDDKYCVLPVAHMCSEIELLAACTYTSVERGTLEVGVRLICGVMLMYPQLLQVILQRRQCGMQMYSQE